MNARYNVLDLFSGIGGFSLGLERAGMHTVAFCEIEPYCRAILRKGWPDTPIYRDVRELTGERLRADGTVPDVICGGFPCQDISEAGQGAGIDGERSGLWREYARLIREVRPRYVIVENVSALLGRGLGRVLGDLASLRFDAEWHCIPACAVNAHHERDRVWIVAYPNATGHKGSGRKLPRRRPIITGSAFSDVQHWPPEPDVCRVVNGLPNWSHRIAALGNTVVPQIPEIIGRAILAADEAIEMTRPMRQKRQQVEETR